MELITYTTNVKSDEALLLLASILNKLLGSPNWQIDMSGSDKKLTVFSPGVIQKEQLMSAIHEAGFKAENLDHYFTI